MADDLSAKAAALPVGSGEKTPRVTIVVLNYRNHEDTVACLASLCRIRYPEVEMVVVDNASDNGSLEHIARALEALGTVFCRLKEGEIDTCADRRERCLLVQAEVNRGYAAGNNLGIRAGLIRGADLILILNNDTEVEPGFLGPLVAYAQSHEGIGGVGPKVVDTDGRIEPTCMRRRPDLLYYVFGDGLGRRLFPGNRWRRRHFYEGEYAFDCPREVDILSGSCMLIKRAVFEDVGLLDENTFLYLEEYILHEKMRAAGWRQAIIPESLVVHKGGGSTRTAVPEHVREAGRRSRRYYLMRYRHCGRFLMWVIELARSRPPAFIRRWRAEKRAGSEGGAS